MEEKNKEYRSLLLRIYPNKSQEKQILKTLGSCRFIYNQMLEERISVYNELKDEKRKLYEYKYKTEKNYKEEFEFLKEVSSVSLQQSRVDLINAYSNFFKSLKKHRKGEKVGFPKFHKKGRKESYREVVTNNNISINFDTKYIKIPKLKNVKYRHRKIKEWYYNASIKSATVKRTPTGKYFVSLLFEGETTCKGIQEFSNNSKVIGLDMSLDSFYVDNLGNSPNYKRIYRENEAKLAKYQKQLSRTKKGSKRREKARLKVAKVHEKIKNQRKDFINKLSLDLVKEYNVIVLESLSLKGMSQALKLGKSVMDLGYSDFIRQLQYKSIWHDKTVIQADKFFASSKLCSFCGYKNKDLKLHEREWVCPNCGKKLDRDVNAGKNLYQYGLEFLGLEQSEVTLVEKVFEDNVNASSTKREAFESLAQR